MILIFENIAIFHVTNDIVNQANKIFIKQTLLVTSGKV